MNQYEAMFLFDPTFGSTFEKCQAEVERLMQRADAELIFSRKWDERRLAYRIKGRKRGVYVLAYFKAPADRIAPLERDVQLSEDILRMLVMRADHVTPEMMERNVAAETGREERAAARAEKATEKVETSDKAGADAPASEAAKVAPSEATPASEAAKVAPSEATPAPEAAMAATTDSAPAVVSADESTPTVSGDDAATETESTDSAPA